MLRQMKVIPSVTQTRTTMVLSTVKDTPRLPLPGVAGVADKTEQKKDTTETSGPAGQDGITKKEKIAS
jgi:hypothetical protein